MRKLIASLELEQLENLIFYNLGSYLLMENRIFEFSELENAPLVPNSVYKGGIKGNVGDDPFKNYLMLEMLGNSN